MGFARRGHFSLRYRIPIHEGRRYVVERTGGGQEINGGGRGVGLDNVCLRVFGRYSAGVLDERVDDRIRHASEGSCYGAKGVYIHFFLSSSLSSPLWVGGICDRGKITFHSVFVLHTLHGIISRSMSLPPLSFRMLLLFMDVLVPPFKSFSSYFCV